MEPSNEAYDIDAQLETGEIFTHFIGVMLYMFPLASEFNCHFRSQLGMLQSDLINKNPDDRREIPGHWDSAATDQIPVYN